MEEVGRLAAFLILIGLAGCADLVENPREPAAVIPDARFTPGEEHLCSTYQCRHFVAPCTLTEPNRVRPVSQLGNRYIEEALNYTDLGYCQRPPRPIPGNSYGEDSCMYVFVRGPDVCPR